jgi:hypothetical protein
LENLIKEGIKPKSMFYPQIALLILIEKGNDNLSEIKAIWEQLNEEKVFKWKKDINFMMAVHFVISDKIENSSLLQTNFYSNRNLDPGSASSINHSHIRCSCRRFFKWRRVKHGDVSL